MARLPIFFYRYLSSRFLSSIVSNAFAVYFLWEIVVTFKSVFLAGLIPTISLASDRIVVIPIGHLIDRFNNNFPEKVYSKCVGNNAAQKPRTQISIEKNWQPGHWLQRWMKKRHIIFHLLFINECIGKNLAEILTIFILSL